MAAIHDLLDQIDDPRLRERIRCEWLAATRNRKFGLVYERHLPELLPLPSATPRTGDLVARRGRLDETWRVRRIVDTEAEIVRGDTGELMRLGMKDLWVVKRFGDPIYPTLTPIEEIRSSSANAPSHVLIEADNYHALQLLDYIYEGAVDCIYIDPPYNTGARDWKYNNDYVDAADSWRHSKWLSFMERRLRLAKRLLKPDTGVLICTIDEHEVHHLAVLLASIFPESLRQLVTIVINQKGVWQGRFSRVEEYAVFCFMPDATVPPYFDDLLSRDRRDEKRFQTPRWEWLQRGGNNATPTARPGLFYPIYIDPDTRRVVDVGTPLPKGQEPDPDQLGQPHIAWPIRKDGTYATWQVGPETLRVLLRGGLVRVGGYDRKRRTWTIQYLGAKAQRQIEQGVLLVTGRDPVRGCLEVAYAYAEERSIKTVWHRQLHDSGIYGSSMLSSILGGSRGFTFPKSVYATKDAIAVAVRDKPRALVLDFFAGSGTTLNSVNLLNAADGGTRQCILVTNNEVPAEAAARLAKDGSHPGDPTWEEYGICRSVTWPRSKYTILGKRDDQTKLPGDYFTGRLVERAKSREFTHIELFVPEDLRTPTDLSGRELSNAQRQIDKRRQGLVALVSGLPKSLATSNARFLVSETHDASLLFDPDALEDWLNALDGQDHVVRFYIVATSRAEFNRIQVAVEELLGPRLVQEEEKRPMADGFQANLAYYRLDFLDKDRVELGEAFREISPLLWLKAGAIGPRPHLPTGPLPEWFAPAGATFAVLLDEARINPFLDSIRDRTDLTHLFIVTDGEEAFRTLADEARAALNSHNPWLRFTQLYRDYLANFGINVHLDETVEAEESRA